MSVFALRNGSYLVETEGGRYIVDIAADRCECLDYRIRDVQCKHLRRVRLEISEGAVPAPYERSKPCGVCGRSVFVPVDHTGPNLCSRHRFEPGMFVTDRQRESCLVVTEVTNRRADEYLTSTGKSVDEYDSNTAYGCHEPVVEAVYIDDGRLASGVIDVSNKKQYAFPASRLQRMPATDWPNAAIIGIST